LRPAATEIDRSAHVTAAYTPGMVARYAANPFNDLCRHRVIVRASRSTERYAPRQRFTTKVLKREGAIALIDPGPRSHGAWGRNSAVDRGGTDVLRLVVPSW
jgi:hypothetical protein